VCRPPGCGDNIIDSAVGEDCDPPDGAACLADCTWQCTDLRGCDDGDVCNGTPTCSAHVCSTEPALACADTDDCTVDSCDGTLGCQNVLTDLDGDGFAPKGVCVGGTDCDDTNFAINPSAAEICNEVDDDCDGTIDDGTMPVNWYPDVDDDTFGDASGAPMSSCMPIVGRVTNSDDCDDADEDVHPQDPRRPTFFAMPRGDGSYDYDCNGVIEKNVGLPRCGLGGRNTCIRGTESCDGTSGFSDRITNCGARYTLRECANCTASLLFTCGLVDGPLTTLKCR
jgi:Putative metal-binding motif